MRASAVVNSVIYNYLNAAFITASGFAYTAFMVHRLSHGRYGILVLTTSILSYSTLLDLGIGIVVMKMVAERAGGPHEDEVPEIVSSALTIFSAIGLLVLIISLCAEPFIGELFNVHGSELRVFRVCLAIAALSVAITFPSALYTATHQAYQDYRYLSILGIIMQAIQVTVGMLILLAGWSIIPLVSLGAVLNVSTFFFKARHSRIKFGTLHRPGKASWKFARGLFTTTIWIFLFKLATVAIFSTDLLVVGAILGTAAVASYQVALGPGSAIQVIGDQANMVSLTAATSLRVEDAIADLRRLLLEATGVVAAIAMPGVVIFAAWGRQLLILWAGHSYRSSYATLVVLSLGLLVAALQGTSVQVIIALNKSRVFALLSIGEATINLVTGILLAPHVGIVGVAAATTIPISLATFVIYMPMACRLIALRVRQLARRLLVPTLVNAVAYAILRVFTAPERLFSNLLVFLAASAGVCSVSFCASAILDRGEREIYLEMLRKVSPRAFRAS
jgi:O-antigen/teichoic acid export membrane protein